MVPTVEDPAAKVTVLLDRVTVFDPANVTVGVPVIDTLPATDCVPVGEVVSVPPLESATVPEIALVPANETVPLTGCVAGKLRSYVSNATSAGVHTLACPPR